MFQQSKSLRKLCLGLAACGMSAATAFAGPEIQVKLVMTLADGTPFEAIIEDGAQSSYPNVFVGDEQLAFFFIENVGDETLVLDAPESVSLIATPVAGYSLINQPSAPTIGPGGSRFIRVSFEPTRDGLSTARMFIFSNADNTAGPFDTTLTGTGIEIEDCNENGVDDGVELDNGDVEDCNFNDVPDECELDTDNDGWIDDCDNCPEHANADQLDTDDNGVGDVCDVEICEYDEIVCGTDGHEYADSCELDDAGVEMENVGPCVEELECPEIYTPVCGVNGHTYDSMCFADLAGIAVDYQGECVEEDENLECTEGHDPVCGMDGTTYNNACEAAAHNTSVASDGPCQDEDEADENEVNENDVDEIVVGENNEQDENGDENLDQNNDEANDEGNVQDENAQNNPDDGQGQNEEKQNEGGFCGAGLVGMIPVLMLGLGSLKTSRVRRRR